MHVSHLLHPAGGNEKDAVPFQNAVPFQLMVEETGDGADLESAVKTAMCTAQIRTSSRPS